MTSISVNDLSLSFGIKPVLEKVSFSLEEGDKLGIIGVNGSGKSTLFKLILGELEPDEGNIFFSKNKRELSFYAEVYIQPWLYHLAFQLSTKRYTLYLFFNSFTPNCPILYNNGLLTCRYRPCSTCSPPKRALKSRTPYASSGLPAPIMSKIWQPFSAA